MLNLVWIILDHPRSAIVCPSLVYKFGVDQIYSFGDIAILRCCFFALKMHIHVALSAAHAQNQR